ncbi:MAG: GldG family protein [Verrucomicrobiales bacterium]|nr:GldG family protein [Verrucomicrobiales bacterium]
MESSDPQLQAEKDTPPRSRSSRPYFVALRVAFQILLVLIIYAEVNYLSFRNHQQWDLTQNHKFTLSETSINFLSTQKSKVKIIMAFMRSSDLFSDVHALLSEYERNSEGRISLQVLDLSRDRERLLDLSNQHGLTFDRNSIVLLTPNRTKILAAEDLITRSTDRQQRVMEFRGEEVITASLLQVTEKQQKKIYLTIGNRKAEDLVKIGEQLSQIASTQNIRIESLNLASVQSIPADADAVFIAAPEVDLEARHIKMLESYWNEQHGGLLIFLNPQAQTPNLNAFIRAHGIAPQNDRVLSVAAIPGMARQKSFDVPTAFMPGSPITRHLAGINLQLRGQTQSLKIFTDNELLEVKKIRPLPLMVAGSRFWGETDYQEEVAAYSKEQDNPPPVYTAASVEKGATDDPSMKIRSSRMVIVSNPDLIDPAGNTSKINADFTMASLNWMVDRSELIGISPRKLTTYTLAIEPNDLSLLQTLSIFILPGIAFIFAGAIRMIRRY